MHRRLFLTGLAAGSLTALARPAFAQQAAPVFKLPPLGYAYEALEPHIDAATMRIHHGAHHQAYVNNANALVSQWSGLGTTPMRRYSPICRPCPKTSAPACATMSAATGTTASSGS